MKIFLEGKRPHFSAVLGEYLKPGENEVPDELGRAIVSGCEAYCKQIEEHARKRLDLAPDKPIPAGEVPKPIFRLVEEKPVAPNKAGAPRTGPAVATKSSAASSSAPKDSGASGKKTDKDKK